MKYALSFIFLMFHALFVSLNAQSSIDMADTMRENGKIYVVVAVLAIVFAGILLFLIRLERRLNKLEDQQKEL